MNRAHQLIKWIKQQHKGQQVRRTTEPYINHLIEVAEMSALIPLGYETGLCHDLFEETEVSKTELYSALIGFGYSNQEANFILNCTIELTDVFTKKAYPDLTKKVRKKREAARLVTISSAAQTVKYGDLIYNMAWMLKYDLKHAGKYLWKKQLLLMSMTKGDRYLHRKALKMAGDALRFVMNHRKKIKRTGKIVKGLRRRQSVVKAFEM